MKIVKALLVLILVLAAVLVLGGFLLSPKFSVARSVSIAAPPDKVYALVVDPRVATASLGSSDEVTARPTAISTRATPTGIRTRRRAWWCGGRLAVTVGPSSGTVMVPTGYGGL